MTYKYATVLLFSIPLYVANINAKGMEEDVYDKETTPAMQRLRTSPLIGSWDSAILNGITIHPGDTEEVEESGFLFNVSNSGIDPIPGKKLCDFNLSVAHIEAEYKEIYDDL